MLPQLHREDSIKMDSNPSYELYTGQGSDDVLQPNPSYDVNKASSKTIEDHYEDVQTNEFKKNLSHHNSREDNINMESNPSYGELGSSNMDYDVIIEPNPSYQDPTRMETNDDTIPGCDVAITPNPAYVAKPNPQIIDQNDSDDDDDYI